MRDLLFHLPRRYDDLREMRTLDDLHAAPDGAIVSARVRVTDVRVQQSFRRRVQVTTAFLADETGTAEATWFGRRFIERRMHAGDELIVSGKLKHRGFGIVFDDPEFQKADAANLLHVGRIVPVYRLTSGLTAARLRQAMREALDKAGYAYPEYLPRRRCAPRRRCRRSPRRSSMPTTRRRSRRATRRCAGSRSTSCSPSSWGWSRGGGLAAGHARRPWWRTTLRDRAIRAALEASLARKLGHEAALTADQAHSIDEIRERPRAAGADAPARPGRRRLGQDGGRGVGARRGRARGAAGGAARADGPPRPAARGDASATSSRTSRCRSRC